MFNKLKQILNKNHIRTNVEDNEAYARITHKAGLFSTQVDTTFKR